VRRKRWGGRRHFAERQGRSGEAMKAVIEGTWGRSATGAASASRKSSTARRKPQDSIRPKSDGGSSSPGDVVLKGGEVSEDDDSQRAIEASDRRLRQET